MMAESAGFTLRRVGGVGMLTGSWRMLWEMAVCTSWAAASMLRDRSNCSVMLVLPVPFWELMEVSPAMLLNWRSRGVATEEAMFSGLAPGRLAETLMVGKSTLGSSLTGRLV